MNRDVPVSLDEGRTPTRSAIPPQDPTAQTSALPSVTVEPALDARRAPRVKLPKVELKRFDGRLTDWATFWDMSVHNNAELTDVDRCNYLHSLLEGSAANAISGLSLTTANYSEAITILQKRFDNKQQVVNKHIYDQAEGHIRRLKSLGVPLESYGSLLAPILMKRLPHELCVIISKEVGAQSWNLDKMMEAAETSSHQ